jgi:hypothetical protein
MPGRSASSASAVSTFVAVKSESGSVTVMAAAVWW